MLGLTADDPGEEPVASRSARFSVPAGGFSFGSGGGGLLLNDEETLRAPARPWPPPGGLAADEDLFAEHEAEAFEEAFTPRFLRPGGAKDIIGSITSTIDPGRAAAVSVVLHLILVLVMLLAPPSMPRAELPLDQQPDPMGLIAMMKRAEPEAPIPVGFYPAPGPKAKAPGKNPLPSDLDRQAHGGDPKLPKAETPKAVSRPGIQELDPGRRGAQQQVAEARPRAGEPDGSHEPPPPESAQRPDDSRLAATQPSQLSSRRPLAGIPTSAMQGLTADQVTKIQREPGRGDGGDEGCLLYTSDAADE